MGAREVYREIILDNIEYRYLIPGGTHRPGAAGRDRGADRGYGMLRKKDDPHSRGRLPGGGRQIPLYEAGQFPRAVRHGLYAGEHHLCPQHQEYLLAALLRPGYHRQLLFFPGTARYVRGRNSREGLNAGRSDRQDRDADRQRGQNERAGVERR